MKSLLFFLFAATAALRAEVAVSLRYFKPVGESHWHLYLFQNDGKLIRQLTAPEDAHDMNPIFSEGGKTVVFVRKEKAATKWMEIPTAGGKPHALAGKPEWWDETMAGPKPEPEKDPDVVQREGQEYYAYAAANDGVKVLLHRGPTEYDAKPAESGWLIQGGKEIPLSQISGFTSYYGETDYEGAPFLQTQAPRGFTFLGHHDSTSGTSLMVIDFKNPRVITLSENGGTLFFQKTGSGFFCVCQERYQPLPKTEKTVNCLYLDHWDAQFHRTRFAKRVSLFGGGSIREKGQPQLNLPWNP